LNQTTIMRELEKLRWEAAAMERDLTAITSRHARLTIRMERLVDCLGPAEEVAPRPEGKSDTASSIQSPGVPFAACRHCYAKGFDPCQCLFEDDE